MPHLNFREMMECCTNPDSARYHEAWRQFIERYNDIIYRTVIARCSRWNSMRIHRQIQDAVNDIVSEVYQSLLQKLSLYNDFDNESSFPFWLRTFCWRTAGGYLKRKFIVSMIDGNVEDIQAWIGEKNVSDTFDSYELFEYMVDTLRTEDQHKRGNLERDINLFFLYAWEDLSHDAIEVHPCFSDIGSRVTEVAVSRIRNQLKDKFVK